jgi:hypothetical protein
MRNLASCGHRRNLTAFLIEKGSLGHCQSGVHAQNKCDSKSRFKATFRTTQIKAYYKAEIQLLAANETAGMS